MIREGVKSKILTSELNKEARLYTGLVLLLLLTFSSVNFMSDPGVYAQTDDSTFNRSAGLYPLEDPGYFVRDVKDPAHP